MSDSAAREHPSAFICSNISNTADYTGTFNRSGSTHVYPALDTQIDYSSVFAQNAALKEHWINMKNALDVCNAQSGRIGIICQETQSHATSTQRELEERFHAHYAEIQKAISFFSQLNAQNLSNLQMLQESVAAHERAQEEHERKFTEFMQSYQREKDEVRSRKNDYSERIKQLGRRLTDAETREKTLTEELQVYLKEVVDLREMLRNRISTKLGAIDSIEDYRKYIESILFFRTTDQTGSAQMTKDLKRGDRTQELTRIIINQDADRYTHCLDGLAIHSTPRKQGLVHSNLASMSITEKQGDYHKPGADTNNTISNSISTKPSSKILFSKKLDGRPNSAQITKEVQFPLTVHRNTSIIPSKNPRTVSAMASFQQPRQKNVSRRYLFMSNTPVTKDKSIEEEVALQRRQKFKAKQEEQALKQDLASSASLNLGVQHVNGWEVVREAPRHKVKTISSSQPLTEEDLGPPVSAPARQITKIRGKKSTAKKRASSSKKNEPLHSAKQVPPVVETPKNKIIHKDIYKEEQISANLAKKQDLEAQISILANKRKHMQQQLKSLLGMRIGKDRQSSEKERGERMLKIREKINAIDSRNDELTRQLEELA